MAKKKNNNSKNIYIIILVVAVVLVFILNSYKDRPTGEVIEQGFYINHDHDFGFQYPEDVSVSGFNENNIMNACYKEPRWDLSPEEGRCLTLRLLDQNIGSIIEMYEMSPADYANLDVKNSMVELADKQWLEVTYNSAAGTFVRELLHEGREGTYSISHGLSSNDRQTILDTFTFNTKALVQAMGEVNEEPSDNSSTTPDSSENYTDTRNLGESTPVLNDINPLHGPIGTEVEITGLYLNGFEGETYLYFIKSDGEMGSISVSSYVPEGATSLKFIVPDKMCHQNMGASGLPCPSYMTMIPGIYRVYAVPFSIKSNEILFGVTSE